MEKQKQYLPRWVIISITTTMVAIIGLLVTITLYAASESMAANSNATSAILKTEQLSHRLTTHAEVAKEKEAATTAKLESILLILKEYRSEQKLILEKLIRLEEQTKRE